ncbi:hypothetical protein Tco_1404035 [Tanacetum coccineum]
MTTPSNNSQMHNDIIAAGSKDRPPMLVTGRYAQWQSRLLRYVNTKSNKKEMKQYIFDGPYVMTRILIPAKLTTTTELAVPEHTVSETYENTLPENRAYIDVEDEAIHMILSGIRDDMYSTVDACTKAKEIRIAIERLQEGELLNKQDVKTNLLWEFGKFTLRNGECIESYYSRSTNLPTLTSEPHQTLEKNVDSTPSIENDRQIRQFRNQRIMTLARAKETVDNQIHEVLLVIDDNYEPTYDAEPLEKVQSDDDYNVFANNRQHSKQPDSINDICVVEMVDSNVIPDSSNMCNNEFEDDQNANDHDEDECVALANLISNLKLDIDENKKIQKQLRKANVTLTHEMKECKSALEESNNILDRCKSALHDKEVELEKYKTYKSCQLEKEEIEHLDELHSDKTEFSNEYDLLLQECLSKDIMCDALSSMADIDEYSKMACTYLEKIKECEYLKAQLQDKDIAISELKKLIEKSKGKYVETKFDKPSIVLQTNAIKIPKPSVLDTRPTQTRTTQLPQTFRNSKPCVSTSTRVIHNTSVSRLHLRSTQMKDKVMPNNSQVKIKKKEVEDHYRISSFSNKTKYVTACNDSLKSRTLNVNAVCVIYGKCVFNSNHDACVSKFLNDVNARTKKTQEVHIRTRKPTRKANRSVAASPKKIVALDFTIQKSRSYFRMLYENTTKAWTWWIEKQCPLGYEWIPKTKKKWVPKIRTENVKTSVSSTIDIAIRMWELDKHVI